MRLTLLIDNSPAADPLLAHEHGLSIYFEADGRKYLLDTGLTGKAIQNAATMRIDLTTIDALILSHGHIDHTGGLQQFLLSNEQSPVYASQMIALTDYQSTHHGHRHSLSPDHQLIQTHRHRFHLQNGDLQLSTHVWLVTSKQHDFPCPKGNAWQTANGQPYGGEDEIAVAIEEGNRLHILAACSHSGLLNIIRSCQEATGIREVASYTGGLHLLDDADDDVESLCDRLNGLAPTMKLYTGHCTGACAVRQLQARLHDRFHLFKTGETLNLSDR